MVQVEERKSLREIAYDAIRERIVDLSLSPGSRLVERDLATELNVSRIPLREAMQQLQQDGLVVLVPRQGAIVSPFTVDDVRDLFDVRESLEVLAARLAAERADDDSLAALASQLDAARAATKADDKPAIAAANAKFHSMIVDMSANPLLESLLRPLEARVQWLFHLTKDRDPGQQCLEHEHLYAAIAGRDPDRAAASAFSHVHSGREMSLRLAATWADDGIDPVAATKGRRRGRSAG
ncbi:MULTISPECIES: GntR family transcriptional regulator [Nocardiaceae]|jgi:DNA-binding GntR family transcriptional regulator|uniref:GntR family transcriptional regulator n=1 Tax=Nocardiaceae TaxID=85025 RepID=UPI0005661BF5|nr:MULTISPECIES: GntR family transcriptional regulator [Rhodococcus]OZE99937.1 GntR family transcriptional regulator [Rhodococcus sp. 15-1189-1-1a]OZF12515.1 GntR family transcriptional regulator [Rhodococcus sp. 14-2686-1-2]OZF52392.1 GntR family transcriptional regulator [Rhodococcus sp. 14-2470-1b]